MPVVAYAIERKIASVILITGTMHIELAVLKRMKSLLNWHFLMPQCQYVDEPFEAETAATNLRIIRETYGRRQEPSLPLFLANKLKNNTCILLRLQ